MSEQMAEAHSSKSPNENFIGTKDSESATRDPIQIDQFWGNNKLVWPWMESYLPKNRMFADGFASVLQLFIGILFIIVIFHCILKKDIFLPILGIPLMGYLLGSFNIRMARAQQKFLIAKRNGGRDE